MNVETNKTETYMDSMEDDPLASQESRKQPFFACYLLCSLSSRYKGCTYIGFTVNPRRRIRQHNGEIPSGAWKTKRRRPWEMIICIYGFPSQVSALQFEWAWQNPKLSLAVREAAKGLNQLGGIAGQIRLAYTMLTLPEWKSLNLTVNFLSTKYISNIKGLPTLPYHMKVQICPVDELPCYKDNWPSDEDDDLEEHLYSRSDAADLEEETQGDKNPLHQKESYETEMQQEQETYQQPAKKCRRRVRPSKQKNFNFPADELGSKTAVPSLRNVSSSMVQAAAQSTGQDNLNSLRTKHDVLFEISDSESSEDVYSSHEQRTKFGVLDSSLVSTTPIAVNLKEDVSCAIENNKYINFTTNSCFLKDTEAEKTEDISHESTIKNRPSAASDPVETEFSNKDGKCGHVVKDSDVDIIIENMDDFSIKSRTTISSNPTEFPTFQEYSPECYISPLKSSNPIEFPTFEEYSPACYISPLKTSDDALFAFISPSMSMSTNKLTNVKPCFLSPVASTCPVITISSTPRAVSRHFIDLTDSPAS